MHLSFPERHLFQLLKQFENQHLPLDLFLNHYFKANKALGSKDRQLIAGAVFGMTRWRSLIDHLIGENPSWDQRYAFYRSFQPANYLMVNAIPVHVRVSFPQDLFTLLEADYGQEKAMHLCQVSNTEAPTTIRINPLKATREALLNAWNHLYEAAPCSVSELGIQFKKRAPLTATQEFRDGHFEIQDEASQLIAQMVHAIPGQHVMDYCSGSGGKALGFAHLLQNKGQIYLHDVRSHILEQAKKRLNRAGIQNVQFLVEGHTSLKKLQKKMDWVLADVPCSGTGTLRRNPDQKWKFSLALLNRLVGQQRMIFEKALSYLKPGGTIVYSTCSMLRAENEKQVDYFLEHHNLELAAPLFTSQPTYNGMDGFFGAALRRKG